MKNPITTILIIIFLSGLTSGQQEIIQSGPMLGYSEMREAAIWLQTKVPAKVKIEYWDKENSQTVYSTGEAETSADLAFCTTFKADQAEPGRNYEYRVVVNGKKLDFNYPLEFKTQKLWRWREDAPDLKFILGSCAYVNETQYDRPGKPYGANYEIFTKIYEHKPDFMVWLGDNYYLREPDWNTRTGILKRITHTRSLPELQPLLASVHHYAIWDDHDFGPDNSDRSFTHKEKTLEAFKLFFPALSYGINGQPGITSKFEWGDAEFFMLDNRYYRTPEKRKSGYRTILGEEQLQWLIDALVYSKAVFKFIVIGGQVLTPDTLAETYSIYPEEKEKLLSLIAQEGIKGVIFLSGDRHFSEITKLERPGTYPLYDFTISSFTAGSSKPKDEKINNLRVPGTLILERNFAEMSINGSKQNRVLTCKVFNAEGTELWSYEIKASELE